MKTLSVILLLLISCTITFAGKPTAKIDTVAYDKTVSPKQLISFSARYDFNTSSTPDTLVFPAGCSEVSFVHKGGTTGDTILCSVAQAPYGPQYAYVLSTTNENWQPAYDGRKLFRAIIKAQSGTGRIVVVARQR
jgi:hypothetical protein